MTDALCLRVEDYRDPDHWRWLLTDAAGTFLADREVALDRGAAAYGGYIDLEQYLKHYAAPDRWPDDEVRLVEEVGAWIGEHVLGGVGRAILDHGTPVTVRVVVPPAAEGLLYRPLELAHVGGRPLAVQDVALAFEVEEAVPRAQKQPIGDRLRMLAVFSLPDRSRALALRRERHELQRLIREIVQTDGRAIELRVLQYGVSRDQLQQVLDEGPGWDVLHFSGHGTHARLLLEQPDGGADEIGSDELVRLMRRGRRRLRLVVLSSCLSAAATAQETLVWLGLGDGAAPAAAPAPAAGAAGQVVPGVARALVRELDCAVLAMRYPVADEFAGALTGQLYRELLDRGHPLDEALQVALPAALNGGPNPGVPPLSVATPALFGRHAPGLALQAPAAPPEGFEVPGTGLAHFPDEPEHFVGRVAAMARAGAALAPRSGKAGVLFHGMAGAGKTACAVELAYRYEQGRFGGFVWYKAPDEDADITGALLGLAQAMEDQLPGFAMVHMAGRPDAEFDAWLPRLRELLERSSLLIVLDNLESLLTAAGGWRVPKWGRLVAALLDHRGLSRLVLTSRRVPTALAADARVLREPVHALSLDEAAVLARQLPNLGRLLRGEGPAGLDRGRRLVARTLGVVQGHPKLLELAEGQAADPDALERHLERAEAAWRPGEEGELGAFFREGESRLDAEQFLRALGGWTRGIEAALPEASRTLFRFLCAVEEGDRLSWIVEPNWPDLWRRLGLAGEPPAPAETLAPLVAAGLARVEGEEGAQRCVIHPGVAGATRAEAGAEFQAAVDRELAAFWTAVSQQAQEAEGQEGLGRVLVRAGLGAAPYLLRLQEWTRAASLLEGALGRDSSAGVVAAILPSLYLIAEATRGTDRELTAAGALARALVDAGRSDEAEAGLRDVLNRAEARGEWRLASTAAGHLVNLLMRTGRAEEALAEVERMKDYTRRGGFGPWTQLSDEGYRLQLLNVLGRHDEVLKAVSELRPEMEALPETGDREEVGEPWDFRETILDCGRSAALGLDRWEDCLALNAEIIAAKESRGASRLELARTWYNDYSPLLRLGRYAEAGQLLDGCREVFEDEGHPRDRGMVYSALADLERRLGRPEQAKAFEATALRYSYAAGDPTRCGISHYNLANAIKDTEGPSREAVGHRLAAAVIGIQTGAGQLAIAPRTLLRDLADPRHDPSSLPASFEELCAVVERTEGVRFRELFVRLPRRFASGDAALQAVYARTRRAGTGGLMQGLKQLLTRRA